MNLIDIFENYYCVEPNTGCYLWIVDLDSKNQYGIFNLGGIIIGAHRLAYELYKSEIPAGLQICHKCDVMRCVNPDHLWLGTKKDNAKDASSKGFMIGEKNGSVKLNEAQVVEILNSRKEFSQKQLAEKYKVSASCIQAILDGRTWKHLNNGVAPFCIPTYNQSNRKFLDRFNTSFDKTNDCWNWNAELNVNGYGVIRIGKTMILAHRLSFQLFKSNLINGMFVCHSCDNRKCVNPNHLWLGTHQENMNDALEKGRLDNKGENNGRSKFKKEDIINIINLFKTGTTTHELAIKFNTTQTYIIHILIGRVWKSIEIDRPSSLKTKNVSKKLSQAQIEEINILRKNMTITELSVKFNVSRTHIQRITSQNWSGSKN